MEAGLSALDRRRAIERELTGSPVWIYARTMECRISCSLAFSALSPGIRMESTFPYNIDCMLLKSKGSIDRSADAGAYDGLLDARAYRALIES